MSAEPKVSTAIAPDRPTGPASGSSPELHREIVWEPSPERQFSRPTRLVLLVVAIALLWFTGRVLLLGFAGLLFGLFLQTAGRWMSGWPRIPYRMCVGLVTLILLGTLAAAGWRFQNEFVEQWNHFTTTLPA